MSHALLTFSLAACLFLLPTSDAASNTLDWTYEENGALGPKTWSRRYKQCSSAHQSPIDIMTKDAIYDKWLEPFQFSKTTMSNYTIYNGGANAVITFGSTDWKASFTSGTTEAFKPASMHFHWGMTDNTGSEHHMDGVTYALEGHIVMYNSRDYANFSEAVKNVNGLAVVGVFFEHDDSVAPNPTLESITKALDTPNMLQCNCSSKVPESTASLPFFELTSIFPKNKRFFRYKGSLTTPPCTENVLWSLYYDRMTVTKKQLDIFRKLKYPSDGSGTDKFMAGNHRPVLPLNPQSPLNSIRYVASSFKVGVSSAASPIPSIVSLVSPVLIFLCRR